MIKIGLIHCVVCGAVCRAIGSVELEHTLSTYLCRIKDEFIIIVTAFGLSLPVRARVQIGYVDDDILGVFITDVSEDKKWCGQVAGIGGLG